MLDDGTLALLWAYLQRCSERAGALDFELPKEALIFSLSPEGSTWLKPDSLGSYPADVRAARLGHERSRYHVANAPPFESKATVFTLAACPRVCYARTRRHISVHLQSKLTRKPL